MSKPEIEAKAEELFERAGGDPWVLAKMAASYQAHLNETVGGVMEVVGIVGTDGEPKVTMAWGDQRGQLSPDETRQHAMLMLEAAENAVHDAAIFQFFTKECGQDDSTAAHALTAVRLFRRDKWGHSGREGYKMEAKTSDDNES